jgi:hypothetical protein
MIDIRRLRKNPDHFRQGAGDKDAEVEIGRPQPSAGDVPKGANSSGNVEFRRWNAAAFSLAMRFDEAPHPGHPAACTRPLLAGGRCIVPAHAPRR